MKRMSTSLENMNGDLDSIAFNLKRIADSLEMMVRITQAVASPLRHLGIKVPR